MPPGKKRAQPWAQSRFPVTFGIKPRRAFRGVIAQCTLEQQCFAVWIHGFLPSVFSFASEAAISSHDGALQM
jgi:hypothetical protein